MRLLVKNTFNGDHFEIEGNHESRKDEKLILGYFCRFATSALTLRPHNMYIYVFWSIVWFLHLLSHFPWILESRSKLTLFYTKFWVNRAGVFPSTCTSLLLCIKPVQWSYRHFFLYFKPKSALYGLIPIWICRTQMS